MTSLPSDIPPPRTGSDASRRLAVIVARGGSKRIPRKNVRDFLGRPIIRYAIDTALESGLFGRVMVSTEDEEIASVAREGGASVPFMRSLAASNDHATTAQVMHEVLGVLKRRGEHPTECCCLYPTAPLLSVETLRRAHALMIEEGRDMTFPVVRFASCIERALHVDEAGRPSPVQPRFERTRTQDLPPAYHDAGQFYWFRVEPFMHRDTLMSENAGVIVCDAMQVQDIDEEEDWQLAELKYRMGGDRRTGPAEGTGQGLANA